MVVSVAGNELYRYSNMFTDVRDNTSHVTPPGSYSDSQYRLSPWQRQAVSKGVPVPNCLVWLIDRMFRRPLSRPPVLCMCRGLGTAATHTYTHCTPHMCVQYHVIIQTRTGLITARLHCCTDSCASGPMYTVFPTAAAIACTSANASISKPQAELSCLAHRHTHSTTLLRSKRLAVWLSRIAGLTPYMHDTSKCAPRQRVPPPVCVRLIYCIYISRENESNIWIVLNTLLPQLLLAAPLSWSTVIW